MAISGFDCDTKLTPEVIQKFISNGYKFAMRYIGLGPTPQAGDITYQELLNILNPGLGLYLIQHVREPDWTPSERLGCQDGSNAVLHAKYAGYIPGSAVVLDLEGVASGTPSGAVKAHCREWYKAVKDTYFPVLYVGEGCGLTAEELWELPFTSYMRSGSIVPDIPNRGYALTQMIDGWEDPIPFDKDILALDKFGEVPPMMSMRLIEVN